MNDEVTRSISDAKGESVMNKNLKKQKASDKKSTALAQSKVHRKTSGQPNAAQRAKTKKTSSGRSGRSMTERLPSSPRSALSRERSKPWDSQPCASSIGIFLGEAESGQDVGPQS